MSQSSPGLRTGAAPPSTSKLPSLTGLRFAAALFVFLYHTSLTLGPVPPHGPINPFADSGLNHAYAYVLNKGGYVGVSFFFVLSGFVLSWSARPGEGALAFIRRRLVKIYPTHVATWIIAMILFAAAVTPVASWLPNLLLLHAFSSEPATFTSVNPPSWSLSCELLFYLMFPLLIRPIRRIAESRLWFWAGAVVLGMLGVVLITQFVVPSVPDSGFIPGISMKQFWSGYFFPPSRVFEFILGMLLARLVASGRFPRIGVAPAAGLLVLGYAGAPLLPHVYGFSLATVIPIALLIGAAAVADTDGRATFLGSRPMQWLGERSFGFYMSQGIVLLYGRALVGDNEQYSTPVAIAVLVGFLVANLLAGWMLYSWVERPVMDRWGRRQAPHAPAGAPSTPDPVPVHAARQEVRQQTARDNDVVKTMAGPLDLRSAERTELSPARANPGEEKRGTP